MGFELYRRFGFAPVSIVERWERPGLDGAVAPAAGAANGMVGTLRRPELHWSASNGSFA